MTASWAVHPVPPGPCPTSVHPFPFARAGSPAPSRLLPLHLCLFLTEARPFRPPPVGVPQAPRGGRIPNRTQGSDSVACGSGSGQPSICGAGLPLFIIRDCASSSGPVRFTVTLGRYEIIESGTIVISLPWSLVLLMATIARALRV